jgi:hypothetical protein
MRAETNTPVQRQVGDIPESLRQLSPRRTSAVFDVSTKTLGRWRSTGEGPPWVRLSDGAIRYPLVDLQLWLESRPRGGGQ